ncbi:MAG TPA: prepilin-type N-terminal cleavage/methylation domain-containing protein [Burkholderiaceae bacterium]
MRARGFTLIEVLVALLIMAVMALLAWTGIDTMLRTREQAQGQLELTMRLQTVLGQWEQDLRMLQDGLAVEPISFDGTTLHLTRATDQGLQAVTWGLNGEQLDRWAAPAVTTRGALVDADSQGRVAPAAQSEAVHALEGVASWRVYLFRNGAWIDAEADVMTPPASTLATQRRALPTAIRITIQFSNQQVLTRELMIGPGS